MKLLAALMATAVAATAQPMTQGNILMGAYVGTTGAAATSGQAGTLGGDLTDQYFDNGGLDGLGPACPTTLPSSTEWSCPYTDSGLAATPYTTLRFGPSLHYRIPVANGVYAGQLTFVEPTKTAVGQRVVAWQVQGQLGKTVDIFQQAGAKDVPIQVQWLAVVGAGLLDVQVTGVTGYAVMSDIQFAQFAASSTKGFEASLPQDAGGGIFWPLGTPYVVPGFGLIDQTTTPAQNGTGSPQVLFNVDTTVIPTIDMEQAGQDLVCVSKSASTTTFTCALPKTLVAYTKYMVLRWVPDVVPASGATLAVDTLGPIPLSLPTAPVAGQLIQIWYDGTSFRLL